MRQGASKYFYLLPFLWGIYASMPIYAQVEFVKTAQSLENTTLFNPAYAGQFSDKELNTHYISYSGIRKAYRTFYLNGYTQLPSKKIMLGGTIIADIEEDFSQITQTKVLFTYQLFHTKGQKLQAGTEFGVLNYYLEATPYTPALSKWNINGNYGVFYENRKWNFGLSLNNLFRTKIETFDSELIFYRYATFMTQYHTKIGLTIDYKTSIQYQWKEVLQNVLMLENQWAFHEQYFISYTLLNIDLLFLGGGIKELRMGKRKLKIQMMYAFALSSKLLGNTNQYEIALKYY